ncbi:MAG: hypothetical protein JXO49_10540 [Deltaproteobacteria bacterium]|nr:hypothetical protein [Candidatus Anaeroferrophillus wilburensis]MBN2889769.1 hypothetical protein [Deltaproteobacteria bacterium]
MMKGMVLPSSDDLSVGASMSSLPLLAKLDSHLKTMNDRVEQLTALLNLYMEFEEVVRSFILDDNPSLEKQLEAIEECKGETDPEGAGEDLASLVEESVSVIEQLKVLQQ